MQSKEQEYKDKKMEVLQKFKKEFVASYYNYDATFHAIVEMLVRDADPYTIIETLIDDRKAMVEQLGKYVTKYGTI